MQLSPLRYPGGKSKAVKKLEKYVPSGTKSMLSPFFGGGSFENYISKKGVDVHGFDYCDPLVCFWDAYMNRKSEVFSRMKDFSGEILREEFYFNF